MSILISEKHGVNPSLEVCFICGEAMGVALFGHLTKPRAEAMNEAGLDVNPETDAEAPRKICRGAICDRCKEVMETGIFLVCVRDGEEGDNPYRTGKVVAVTEDAVRKMLEPGEILDAALEKRMLYVEESTWRAIGLDEAIPKGGAA